MADTQLAEGVQIGDDIRCTITKVPTRTAEIKTIRRLMRRDVDNARAIRQSGEYRAKRQVVNTRAGRPWVNRQRVSKVVRVETGETWTMRAIPQLTADLRSMSAYLKIEKA
jgi:hypothetical protein